MISPPPAKLKLLSTSNCSSKFPITVSPRGFAGLVVLLTTRTKSPAWSVPPLTVVAAMAMSRAMSKSFSAPRSNARVSPGFSSKAGRFL